MPDMLDLRLGRFGASSGKSDCNLMLLYCQCYFITIATILGTGILGLPVTLSKAGFYPFLLTFIIGYLMQLFVIVSTLEILQYCKAVLSHGIHTSLNSHGGSNELLLLRDKDHQEDVLFDICDRNSNEHETETEEENELDEMKDDDDASEEVKVTEPNLHMMGKLFLHKFVQPIFLMLMFIHFVAVLISYVLAGSEAYGQLFHVEYARLIPIFCWVLTATIIVARMLIRPVIALLTLAKGSLLFGTVVVTVYTGMNVKSPVSDDWRYVQGPFLMGTVALGGSQMVMPMLFDKFEPVRSQMKGFRNSILGGVTTCFFLNVFWCWSVLNIVPQTPETCNAIIPVVGLLTGNVTSSPRDAITAEVSATPPVILRQSCDPSVTLQTSDELGEISTVPLTKIIMTQHKDLQWVAFVIQLFMVISITVSFLTIGSAMQHTISGWVDDVASRRKSCKLTGTCCWLFPRNWFWHYLIGVLAFSVVYVISVMDPKGFVSILEKVASFCLNAMSGPFTFMMLLGARSRPFRHIRISLPTNRCLKNVHYVYLVFYTFAVLYDVITTSMEWAGNNEA